MMNEPVGMDGLTNAQRAGARLAAMGWNQTAIATELKVARETVSRWQQKPAYRRAVLELAGEAQKRALTRLEALTDRAVDILEQGLAYPYEFSVRFRAALAVLRLVGVGAVSRAKAED
jgi:hypothetical protein